MVYTVHLRGNKKGILSFLSTSYLLLTLFIEVYADTLPSILLDKDAYTPFEIATITLIDKGKDKDPNTRDMVTVTVKGRNTSNVTLHETDNNSGVFTGSVKLTPNPLLYPGDIEVRRDDWLVVTYDNLTVSAAEIRYNEAKLVFDKEYYYDTNIAKLILYEKDADRDPYTRDKVIGYIWSDSYPQGIRVTLDEIDTNVGIFEGYIELSSVKNAISKDNMLIVSDNDKITARYIDDTLPKPSGLASDGITTVEMKFIDAYAVYGTGIPANERISVSEPKIVTQFGEEIRVLSSGSRLAVQSQLFNKQPKEQEFVYIVQIKDNDGVIEHIAYISSSIQAKDNVILAQSWTPMKRGNYTIEVFVWDNLDKPVALSGAKVIRVIVS